MNAFSKIDMGEVTRLTQAGKLTEAMALLQGHLTSGSAQASPAWDRPGPAGETKHPSRAIDRGAPGPPKANPEIRPLASRPVPMRPRAPPAPRRRRRRFTIVSLNWARS